MPVKMVAILAGCLGACLAFGQESSTNTPPERVAASMQAPGPTPGGRVVSSISRPAPVAPQAGVVVDGAIPKAIRSKSLLRMMSPFAPKEYGDGTDVLALHPMTGEAQGVTLLRLTYPDRPKPPKSRKSEPSRSPSGT
ncbi:MAG TPA: hypothetical protein PKM43_06870 [Verrucomicrobiota bacterium]|nr:hypothetical protein [Verrucomicrobiota bacterium]HRZ58791.1 hypothetical protein [Candidatus Paceibacterota bacterium]